jgi:hypothetical protein
MGATVARGCPYTYVSEGAGAALRAAPTIRPCARPLQAMTALKVDAVLVFRRGLFLGFGFRFGFYGPRRDDAVHACVGDGLA